MKRIGFISDLMPGGLRRDLCPVQIAEFGKLTGNQIMVEQGYGSYLWSPGLCHSPYLIEASRESIITECEIIVSLQFAPDVAARLKPEQTYLAMMHFESHHSRVLFLKETQALCISLDDVRDSFGNRLVHDYESTSKNSVREAFKVAAELFKAESRGFQVFVVGLGQLGQRAINHIGNFGGADNRLLFGGSPAPLTIHTVASWQDLISEMDKVNPLSPTLLFDITRRKDPGIPLCRLDDIPILAENLIVTDVTADRYDERVVKGIAGIPTGDVDKWKFYQDDPEWETQVPREWQARYVKRCVVLSSYSWPSVASKEDIAESMIRYGSRLSPFLFTLLRTKQIKDSLESWSRLPRWTIENSLWRASLDSYLEEQRGADRGITDKRSVADEEAKAPRHTIKYSS